MFYLSGYTFYLEKDFGDSNINDDDEFELIFSNNEDITDFDEE
jgi:hypothetical protein